MSTPVDSQSAWDPIPLLARRQTPLRVYFRDDDAGWSDAALQRLLDTHARHCVPIDLAVIPVALHDGLAWHLESTARRQPLGVHQHGHRHVNHELTGRKCEFGESRAAGDQLQDIAAGATMLRQALGPAVQPIFTPPWNRCTQATIAALTATGLRALSRDADAAPLALEGLCSLPVHLDWQKRTGRTATFTRALKEADAVGIMLHHAVMDDQDHADLDRLLSTLRSLPCVEFTTMGAQLPA